MTEDLACKDEQVDKCNEDIPEYLRRWPGLYMREGDRIIEASPKDIAVARNYSKMPDKGMISNGRRLTIMTEKKTYQINEEVHIIHVVEVIRHGYKVYVMGPKPVYGEYVDGRLVTEPPPEGEDPLVPPIYSGVIVPSPAVDYNYDITIYRFFEPGTHQIYWKLDSLKSNVLTIKITALTLLP